jgi:hypothetical protein
MDPALTEEIISILDDANDMTIATVREDGYPQATTVSYVNDGLKIYFGCAANSQKAKNLARNSKISLTVTLPLSGPPAPSGALLFGLFSTIRHAVDRDPCSLANGRSFPPTPLYLRRLSPVSNLRQLDGKARIVRTI